MSGVSFSIRIKESAAEELKCIAKPGRTRIVNGIDRLGSTNRAYPVVSHIRYM